MIIKNEVTLEECVEAASKFIEEHGNVMVEMCDETVCKFVANITELDSVRHMLEFGNKVKLKAMDGDCAYALTLTPPSLGRIEQDELCKI